LRQKMALPVMVQQLIWIAAEDGTACDGSAANLDCGRRWHYRQGTEANPDCGTLASVAAANQD
jgi:hypothetical protein